VVGEGMVVGIGMLIGRPSTNALAHLPAALSTPLRLKISFKDSLLDRSLMMHMPQSRTHGYRPSALSTNQQRTIRDRRSQGVSLGHLAKENGISRAAISGSRSGRVGSIQEGLHLLYIKVLERFRQFGLMVCRPIE
jgi:hypothetical protein